MFWVKAYCFLKVLAMAVPAVLVALLLLAALIVHCGSKSKEEDK